MPAVKFWTPSDTGLELVDLTPWNAFDEPIVAELRRVLERLMAPHYRGWAVSRWMDKYLRSGPRPFNPHTISPEKNATLLVALWGGFVKRALLDSACVPADFRWLKLPEAYEEIRAEYLGELLTSASSFVNDALRDLFPSEGPHRLGPEIVFTNSNGLWLHHDPLVR